MIATSIWHVEISRNKLGGGFDAVGYYSDGVVATDAGKIYLMYWAIDRGLYTRDNCPIPRCENDPLFDGEADEIRWRYKFGGEWHLVRAYKYNLDSKWIFAPNDPIHETLLKEIYNASPDS